MTKGDEVLWLQVEINCYYKYGESESDGEKGLRTNLMIKSWLEGQDQLQSIMDALGAKFSHVYL